MQKKPGPGYFSPPPSFYDEDYIAPLLILNDRLGREEPQAARETLAMIPMYIHGIELYRPWPPKLIQIAEELMTKCFQEGRGSRHNAQFETDYDDLVELY